MAAKRFNIDTEELWDCKGIPRPIRFPYSKYRAFGGQFGDDVKSSGSDRKVLYRQSKQNSATKSGLDCSFLRECLFIMQEITANNSRSHLNYTKAARTFRSRMPFIW